jgi:hypothetical protein
VGGASGSFKISTTEVRGQREGELNENYEMHFFRRNAEKQEPTPDSERFPLFQSKWRPEAFLDLLGASADFKKPLPDTNNASL